MMKLVSHIQTQEDALLCLWNEVAEFFSGAEIGEVQFLKRTSVSGIDSEHFSDADHVLDYAEVHRLVSAHKDAAFLSEADIRETAYQYYDEFLKLAYAKTCGDNDYLFWDADTVPCRYLSLFGKQDLTLLDIQTKPGEGEDAVLGRLIPGLEKKITKSFSTGHMLIRGAIMREILEKIEANDALAGDTVWEKILRATEEGMLTANGFSAYELYGNYMLEYYPQECLLREWNTFRQGGDLLELSEQTFSDLEWIGMDFDSICFERGHLVREDNKGLFTNPEYRSKLRPLHMLQAAQGEYAEKRAAERLVEPQAAIAAYREKKAFDEYRLYEAIGDERSKTNQKQAWLSYQHACYLCKDASEKQRLSEKMDALQTSVAPAAIVIVSYQSQKLIRECLESIRRTSGADEYSIIVVDNASTDGAREYLQKQNDITLVCNEKNEGFPKACNQGIEVAAPGEDIFFLNNDTRMTHNALYWLRMGLYESEDTGAAGCVGNYAGVGQIVELMLATPESYTDYAYLRNQPMQNPYADAKILCGFAMLVRRSVIDAYGGMDEAFTPGYYEDTDLSLRIRSKGYRLRICHNSFIYHAGGQSFNKRKDLDEFTDRNLLLLVNRWGTDFMER
ncbi:MAG: glycosyltransferase family 2 protein [Lachnospiraceae bacterium]|nr:glycosyltransferase family 2 protein [Lachnospiraceae bacterium]